MRRQEWYDSAETLDSNDYRIDNIHFTQGGIRRSEDVGDPDQLQEFAENTHWATFGADQAAWTHMEADLPTLRGVYESYRRGGYTGPMSFYVATEPNGNVQVLLRVGGAGDRRRSHDDAPPSVLWKWT
jgi:hypothetical protein